MITPTGKLIITCKLLQQAAGELHAANMYLKGLGSSHLANHLANVINQGPY